MIHPIRQVYHLKRHRHMVSPLFTGKACEKQREFDIFKGSEHRDQIIELKDKSHINGTPCRKLTFGEGCNIDSPYLNGAAIRQIEGSDEVEEGTLSRSG